MLIRILEQRCSNMVVRTSSYTSRILQICPLLKDIFFSSPELIQVCGTRVQQAATALSCSLQSGRLYCWFCSTCSSFNSGSDPSTNASFMWKGGRWLRSNHIWVWATEIVAVRLFTIGTGFFYLVPYNHLSVMCGEKKKVQLWGTSVWKTDSSSFIRKYIIKVLKNIEDGFF